MGTNIGPSETTTALPTILDDGNAVQDNPVYDGWTTEVFGDEVAKQLKKLGAKIETRRRFTDHHRYTEKELLDFINRCINRDVDMIVTTEKDFVRFPHLPRMDVPIYFMRVEIEILSNEETWTECVNRICRPRPIVPARRFF